MAEILVIDDDKDFLNYCERVLGKGNHNTTGVLKVVDAMEKIGRKKFDLILIDLNLPTAGGLTFFESMKDTQYLTDTKMAILTASRDKNDIKEAAKLGVKHYVVKPTDQHGFLEKIELILAGKDKGFLQVT